jgi:DNA-binding transcriptional ArsR family regulator
MGAQPDIAGTAALFGDPARAAMLIALLDGQPRSAGELAFLANISPQTASFHLAKLTSAELLDGERKGRNQLYRLASPAVATAIESLAAVSPMCARSERTRGIALARTCYDHLAGWTSVVLHDALLESGRLAQTGEKEYSITPKGRDWLSTLGVSLPDPARRSPFARPCLDWTERRPHLAGRLAARLLDLFFEQGWLARIRDTRAVRITDRGYREFERHYRVNLRTVPPGLRPESRSL